MNRILFIIMLTASLYSCKDSRFKSNNSSCNIIHEQNQPKIVCIGGLISVGKTTFISKVNDWCRENGYTCKVLEEFKSTSMLNSQAENMPTTVGFYFGHRMQMAFDAPEIARNYDLVIMERSLIDHLAFVEAMEETNLLPEGSVEWTTMAIHDLDPPNPLKFVYLSIPPELAIERQANRGDEYEEIFDLKFTQKLDESYRKILMETYSDPVFLDWTNFGSEYKFDEIIENILLDIPKHVQNSNT